MADGKTHKRVNILAGGVATAASLITGMPATVTMGILAGSIAGTVVTCDYDLNAALPVSFMTKIPGVRLIWGTIWRPYQLAIGHRSFWSHFPFVGTAGRVLYLMAWILGAMWILWQLGFGASPDVVIQWILDNQVFFGIMFLAWAVQDLTHFLLDI